MISTFTPIFFIEMLLSNLVCFPNASQQTWLWASLFHKFSNFTSLPRWIFQFYSCLLLLVWSFRLFGSWLVPLRQYSSSKFPSFYSPPPPGDTPVFPPGSFCIASTYFSNAPGWAELFHFVYYFCFFGYPQKARCCIFLLCRKGILKLSMLQLLLNNIADCFGRAWQASLSDHTVTRIISLDRIAVRFPKGIYDIDYGKNLNYGTLFSWEGEEREKI